MAQISVIVPVYNVEKYLDRCVRSVLGQTFRDLELILVDDGSPDSSGLLCDGYAKLDSRVHVIHQKNGGLSAARNAGLDWVCANSESTWITFVDSDDFIHPEMLARLHQAAADRQTAVSACGYFETDGRPALPEPGESKSQLWQADAFYREHFIDATIACAKLYSRACFETLRYPVGRVHEDEFVTYRLLFTQGTLAFVPAPLYYYFINPQGITKGRWSPKRLDAWDAYEEQIAFFRETGREDLADERFRGYLENAMVNFQAAQEAGDTPEMVRVRKKMTGRIRRLLRRMWHRGLIHFWIDFDILYRFYPFLTRVYRLWLTVKSRLGRNKHG